MPLINTITQFLTKIITMPEEKVKTPRLGQAAKEFNVSNDRIIDILTKNGFEIASQNAKLSADMFLLLLSHSILQPRQRCPAPYMHRP